jgi:hypothetical protein
MVLLDIVNRKMCAQMVGKQNGWKFNQANITLNTSTDFVLLPASAIYFEAEAIFESDM